MIDLRSDSSSTPTVAMRQAIANAPVGNDAFQEDPTVNELERKAAKLMGKESAIFLTSGVMSNLVAILASTCPGDAVLVGRQSHIVRFEAGAPARIGIVTLLPFDDSDGRIKLEQLESFLVLPMSLKPRLLAIENTHNCSGGLVLSSEEVRSYATLAKKYGLHLHIDGARIHNAAVALNLPVEELVAPADSVCFCLTKGLCAPVGAILTGNSQFINRAREMRFQLGGQMRQAGILAAAGIVALDEMMPQFKIDHKNAHILAEGLSEIEGIRIGLDRVQTNILLFDVSALGVTAENFEHRLEERGVYASVFSERSIRFITYRDIGEQEVDKALEITREVAKEIREK